MTKIAKLKIKISKIGNEYDIVYFKIIKNYTKNDNLSCFQFFGNELDNMVYYHKLLPEKILNIKENKTAIFTADFFLDSYKTWTDCGYEYDTDFWYDNEVIKKIR